MALVQELEAMSVIQQDYAVETEGLCKSYPGFQLKDINLKVPRGSIVGLIGENGAGKTTTIKLMLNQINKDAGAVSLLGMDNIKQEKSIKEKIGVVMDEGFFYETFTAKNISAIMKQIYSTWDERTFYSFLKQFDLPLDRAYKDFSKGMAKLTAIAAALSHNPQLLILDEPTSGLDPVVRNTVLDMLRDFIQDERHSVLLSSHITSDLEKVADYISFIHKGEIVLQASKDDIMEEYAMMKCGVKDFEQVDQREVIGFRKNNFGYEALVGNRSFMKRKHPDFVFDKVSLDELMLFYIK